MKVRALRCLVCGHITGLLNKSCDECDGEKLEEIQYDPENSQEPGYVVTVVRKITSMEEGLTWHRSLLENLQPYNIWYDGHEVEISKHASSGKRRRVGLERFSRKVSTSRDRFLVLLDYYF